MKVLYKKKNIEESKFEKLKHKDRIGVYLGSSWVVQTYDVQNNLIVLTHKDNTIFLSEMKSSGYVFVTIHRSEFGDDDIHKFADNLSSFGLVAKISDNDKFVVGKNTKVTEMKFAPVEVGDILYPSTRDYGVTVKFVSKDGSLVAWDGDKNESYYVNRNDRDQLKSLNLKLL